MCSTHHHCGILYLLRSTFVVCKCATCQVAHLHADVCGASTLSVRVKDMAHKFPLRQMCKPQSTFSHPDFPTDRHLSPTSLAQCSADWSCRFRLQGDLNFPALAALFIHLFWTKCAAIYSRNVVFPPIQKITKHDKETIVKRVKEVPASDKTVCRETELVRGYEAQDPGALGCIICCCRGRK